MKLICKMLSYNNSSVNLFLYSTYFFLFSILVSRIFLKSHPFLPGFKCTFMDWENILLLCFIHFFFLCLFSILTSKLGHFALLLSLIGLVCGHFLFAPPSLYFFLFCHVWSSRSWPVCLCHLSTLAAWLASRWGQKERVPSLKVFTLADFLTGYYFHCHEIS